MWAERSEERERFYFSKGGCDGGASNFRSSALADSVQTLPAFCKSSLVAKWMIQPIEPWISSPMRICEKKEARFFCGFFYPRERKPRFRAIYKNTRNVFAAKRVCLSTLILLPHNVLLISKASELRFTQNRK